MQQRAASASTPAGPSRCVRTCSRSAAKRPARALHLQQRRELGLSSRAAVIDHQLLRRALRDRLAEVLADQRQCQIDPGADAGSGPELPRAHEDAVGLQLHVGEGAPKAFREAPVGGGRHALEQARGGEQE